MNNPLPLIGDGEFPACFWQYSSVGQSTHLLLGSVVKIHLSDGNFMLMHGELKIILTRIVDALGVELQEIADLLYKLRNIFMGTPLNS